MSALEPPDPAPVPQLSIWRDMWLKPRAVLREHLAQPAHWSHWLPAILAGIAAVLDLLTLANQLPPATAAQLPKLGAQGILLTALLIGPISGLLQVGIMAFVLRQVGRLFGGQCTPDAMRRGLSLAQVPLAASLIPLLLELWWRQQHDAAVIVMIGHGVRALLNLWALLLLAMTVSEVQGTSLRRAIGTVAAAVLLVLTALALLQPR